MCGVSNEHYAPALPDLALQPFDRRDVDLLITDQCSQKLLDWPLEGCKALAQADKPTGERAMEARSGDIPKTIGVSITHRHESKEA